MNAPPQRRRPSPPSPTAPQRIRIYIVDDHPLIRNAIAKLISVEADMTICGESATAETAYNEIAVLRPDVALVDLSLDADSGFELIKDVRRLDAKIGIVALSMCSETTHGLPALDAGARGYVMKQDAPERIVAAIRLIHAGRMFASRELAARVLNRVRLGARVARGNPAGALSEREQEIAEHIGEGLTTNEIAVRLHVSIKTIETHRARIKHKLQLENSAQLIHFCVRWFRERSSHQISMAHFFRIRKLGED